MHGFRRKRYFRKTKFNRRTYKKTHRSFRGKGRRIRAFKRRLNSVAEKKMTQVTQGFANIVSVTSAYPIGDYMVLNWPVIGAGVNGRIGTKIFIRYYTMEITVANVAANQFCLNDVGILVCKSKIGGVPPAVNMNILFAGASPNGIDWTMLKTNYSKIKVYKFKMGNGQYDAGAGGCVQTNYPNTVNKKFRFKIMKEAELNQQGALSLKSIAIIPIYWPGPWTAIGVGVGAGPAQWSYKATLTYTDV